MKGKTLKKKLSALALAGTVALSLSACSSDKDGEDTHAENAVVDTTSAPADARWESVAGIATPVDSNDGPENTRDSVRSGYAHTPQGAVMAAINGQVALATADDTKWPDVSRSMIAPGQGRDQWAQGRALMSIQPGAKVENPAKFEGFRVSDYNDQDALVLLAAEYPEVGLTVYPVQLTWQDDWKLVLPAQDQAPDLEKLDSLDGFTEFSAGK